VKHRRKNQEVFTMNRKTISRALATVVFALAAASLSWAHEVNIMYQAKLGNGPELQPGTYRLEIVKSPELSEAAFYRDGELIAQVPITIVAESEKSSHTEVHYESLDTGRVINQIRVVGWKDRLVFRAQPAD